MEFDFLDLAVEFINEKITNGEMDGFGGQDTLWVTDEVLRRSLTRLPDSREHWYTAGEQTDRE